MDGEGCGQDRREGKSQGYGPRNLLHVGVVGGMVCTGVYRALWRGATPPTEGKSGAHKIKRSEEALAQRGTGDKAPPTEETSANRGMAPFVLRLLRGRLSATEGGAFAFNQPIYM